MAIGEAAADWAETASAIPGGEDHPLFAVVASWAAFGATMAGDLEQADARVADAERAQGRLELHLPSVARSREVLAFFHGDLEQARYHAEEWVALAQASGEAYELAFAQIALAGTLMPDLDAAIATLYEALRVARDAGILCALSIGLPFLAGILPIEQSARALALLDEAIEVGTKIGDRMGVSQAALSKGGIGAQRGEWRTVLQTAVDAAVQKLQLGDLRSVGASFELAVIAFCALGHLEPAAMLTGCIDASFAALTERLAPHWWRDLFATAHTALLDTFGEQQVATLAAQGAALEVTDAVAYLRAQAEPVLEAD